MGIVSTNKRDFIFRSTHDLLKFVQAAEHEKTIYGSVGNKHILAYPSVSMGSMLRLIFFRMTPVKCGCPIMIKIKKKLLLLPAEKNGNQTPTQSSV